MPVIGLSMRAIERGEKPRRARAPKVVKPPRPLSQLRQRGYPKDWARISKRVRFERAKGVCEQCGKRHGEIVYQGPQGSWQRDGKWIDASGKPIDQPPPWPSRQWWDHLRRYGDPPHIKRVNVILHTAHLDHNPSNCADENLAAFCQACHLRYDIDLHRWTWGVNRDFARGQKVLFAAMHRKLE